VLELIVKEDELNESKLHDSFDDNHERLVRRRYFGYDISKLSEAADWKGAKRVIAVEIISSKNNDPNKKVSAEWRYYYICTLRISCNCSGMRGYATKQ